MMAIFNKYLVPRSIIDAQPLKGHLISENLRYR